MKITIKFIAMDGPPFSEIDAAEGECAGEVLDRLGLKESGALALLINGETVPHAQRHRRALAEGDTLTVFPPIKGG